MDIPDMQKAPESAKNETTKPIKPMPVFVAIGGSIFSTESIVAIADGPDAVMIALKEDSRHKVYCDNPKEELARLSKLLCGDQ
ncbi:MAG: hypothetical protein ACPG47_02100 [Leucothrix sp.]